MSENETTQTTAETTGEAVATTASTEKKSPVGIIAAILIVAVIILGVLYKLEKEGRSSTNIFASIIESQQANSVVATVNGEEIINSDLELSVRQFSQAATAQGVDTSSEEAQSEIRGQALDVLVNTELLKQAAEEQGISISDEEVTERLNTITEELGGTEVLEERMEELGIDPDRLQSDIKDELTIQALLDSILSEQEIVVTPEEVNEVYVNAGGEEAGLPALEEVQPQIEAQLQATKEQSVIEAFVSELRENAEIEINEEA
ncbi:MAG: SurA N-terminal domain-containing protein [Candidatus Kaiserbacteria bacterium]|nr:SurA N-terminal domain-containing protein [Candidatus Kaiserbacteria bacterium]MCB9816773.1 SurA N-terminal domain-containing protein [Candidatus Nomurabacteria bacterium]